ncbi:unnamed protein product [Anisakis simplex]|uniref:t-SNARE coiled-coil homology domain-containing protein n=1 Tax=Anisakis simplex TaxID=6269 RepID=A0A0M3K296_ANISI|nr:unnamed protein product [Anisakis simplex]
MSTIARTIAGNEPTQELFISQYVRGGNEYSRWTYTTMFPLGEKPEYVYMPKIRPLTNVSPSSVLPAPSSPVINTNAENVNDVNETKQMITKNLSVYITKQLSTCENALQKARVNIDNLKILAGKDTQTDLQRLDKETKALLGEINSLNDALRKSNDSNGEINVSEKLKVK